MFNVRGLSITALLIAATAPAEANPTITKTVFATGAAVMGTAANSITTGDGSVWVEYGNGVNSTGVNPGSSTIVQYSSTSSTVQYTFRSPAWSTA